MNIVRKLRLERRRHLRARKTLHGTAERPRMSVRFSGQHIYVQFVDDDLGVTLASASTLVARRSESPGLKANAASAKQLGVTAAEQARAKGIRAIVFDRGGARYHGKVKALADAAREGGLVF